MAAVLEVLALLHMLHQKQHPQVEEGIISIKLLAANGSAKGGLTAGKGESFMQKISAQPLLCEVSVSCRVCYRDAPDGTAIRAILVSAQMCRY